MKLSKEKYHGRKQSNSYRQSGQTELRSTPSGTQVASFTLATSERFRDKSGQRQGRTEWHNIVAWGKLAELASTYLKKGRSAYIEGRITNRSWDDRDGNKKYKTEIVANQIVFLNQGSGGQAADQQQAHEVEADASSQFPAADAVPAQGPDMVAEDELPF